MLRLTKVLKNRSGFLLLEVLVSITIISLGLVYIARSFSSSTRAIETAALFLKSISLAEEKLWELEAIGESAKGRDAGNFKEDDKYKWETEADELNDLPINSVKLKVDWEGVRRKQSISFETYLWSKRD